MTVPANPRCGAKLKRGDDLCGQKAGWGTDHPGFGHCKLHGGSTPTGKKHAKTLREEAFARILEMTDPALTRLLQLVRSAESEAVALGAVRDVLDRAGLGAKHVHEHTGPDGGPIPVEVRAAELLDRARKIRPTSRTKSATRRTRPKSSE